jgi:hypothetical protein
MDFSALGELPDVYAKAKLQRARNDTLAALGQGASVNDVSKALMAAGDIENGMSLAQLGNAQARQDWQKSTDARDFNFRKDESTRAQGNSDREYGLSKRKLDIAENEPKIIPYGGGVMRKDGTVIREPNAGGLLDDETIGAMADQYRAGDTSVLTNLGRGAQGAENIVKLRQAIAKKNAALGEGGVEQAGRNAEFGGVKAAARTVGVKGANIDLAATEFNQVLPIVVEASNAVNRTNYPDLNKIIQAGQERTGDPAIVKFGGGINTLVNIYARAISPQGVGTVADKEHAREILQKAWSQGQFNAAVGMMKQEIDAALQSPGKVRDEQRKRFLDGNKPQAAPTAAPGATTETGVRWRVVQ